MAFVAPYSRLLARLLTQYNVQKLAAVVRSGLDFSYIHTSIDSGVTWTEQTGSGDLDWYAIASSSDGSVRQVTMMQPTRHPCVLAVL